MASMDKINFNISSDLKHDIERLANSHGKTLSAFMLDVCNILVESNKDRIREQAEREKQPINFGNSVETKNRTIENIIVQTTEEKCKNEKVKN